MATCSSAYTAMPLARKPGGWYEKKIVSYKNVTTGKGKKKKPKKVPVYKSYYVKNTHKGTETYIWAADRVGFKGDAINQRQEESGEKADSSITFRHEFAGSPHPRTAVRRNILPKASCWAIMWRKPLIKAAA